MDFSLNRSFDFFFLIFLPDFAGCIDVGGTTSENSGVWARTRPLEAMAPLNATQKKNPNGRNNKRSKNVAPDWKYYTTGWCGDYIGKTLSSPPPADRCSIFLFLLIDSNIINERIYKKGEGGFFFSLFFSLTNETGNGRHRLYRKILGGKHLNFI